MTDTMKKALIDGTLEESTQYILASMRHGIIDPDASVRQLLKDYALRLEIAIRRELTEERQLAWIRKADAKLSNDADKAAVPAAGMSGRDTRPDDLRAETPATPTRKAADQNARGMNENKNGLAHAIDMPEIGLHFNRIRSDGITYFIGKWKNEKYCHVYTLRVEKCGGVNGLWGAEGENDGRHLFMLTSQSRQHAEKLGYAALRKYIRIGHRRTLKKLKGVRTEDDAVA